MISLLNCFDKQETKTIILKYIASKSNCHPVNTIDTSVCEKLNLDPVNVAVFINTQ